MKKTGKKIDGSKKKRSVAKARNKSNVKVTARKRLSSSSRVYSDLLTKKKPAVVKEVKVSKELTKKAFAKLSKLVQTDEKKLTDFGKKLIASQKDLDPNIAKALDEQFMDLI